MFIRRVLWVLVVWSFCAALAGAGDLTWSGTVNGNWDQATLNWAGGTQAWTNANNDGAVFTGLVPTITLTEPIVARSLAFTGGSYTFSGGTLSLTSLGSSTAGPNTIFSSSGTHTFRNVLAGSNGLTKTGTTGINIQSASILSGAFTIGEGTFSSGTTNAVTVNSATGGFNGSLANIGDTLIQNNGQLLIQNNLVNSGDRFNNAANITLQGGRLQYTAGSGFNNTETFGNLNVQGWGVVTGVSAGGTNSTTLTFGNLTRSDNFSTVYFRGAFGGTAGGATVQANFANSAALQAQMISDPLGPMGGQNTAILPWVAGSTSATSSDPRTFVTYDGTGLRVISQTDAAFVAQLGAGGSFGGGTFANRNVNVTGTPANVTGTQRINALAVNTTVTIAGTGTLQVFSGVVTNFNTTTFNGPTLDFGGNTGYFHLGFPMNINSTSSITGSNGVVVSALGSSTSYTLTFNNTVANTFTGGLFINGNAQVAFSNDNQLGAAGGGITFNGGTLRYSAAPNLTLNRPITINGAGARFEVGNAAATLTVNAASLTGSGNLTKVGAGTLFLTGNASHTGATFVNAGTLQYDSGNALGTGAITLAGGSLQATATTAHNRNILATTASSIGVTTGNTLTYTGTITSAANLTFSGGGQIDIGTAQPGITAGVTLNSTNIRLHDNGTLQSATGVTVNTAFLRLDNTAINLTNRLGAGTNVTLNASELRLDANAAGTTQTFGNLTIGGGTSFITLNPLGAGATLQSLGTYTNGGFVVFRGPQLGQAGANASRVFLSGVADGTFLTGALGDNNPNGLGDFFVQYSAAFGVVEIGYDQTNGDIQNPANFGTTPTTANFRILSATTNDVVFFSSNRINSLTMGGTNPTLNGSILPLFITSGNLFVQAGATGANTTGAGFATLQADPGVRWNIIANSNLQVDHVMIGDAGLTKSGAGATTFNGGMNVTGTLTVAGGQVILNAPTTFSGTTTLANGSTLTVGATGTFSPGGTLDMTNATLNLNQAGGTSFTTITGTGTINVGAAANLSLTGGAQTVAANLAGVGAVNFNPAAAAALTLSGDNSAYSGLLTANNGSTLVFNGINSVGNGDFAFTNAASATIMTFNTGNLAVAGDIVLSNAAAITSTLTNGTNQNQTITLNGLISGGNAAVGTLFRVSGPANDTSTFVLTNAGNSFTATIDVFEGVLGFTSNAALGNAANSVNLFSSATTGNPRLGGLRFDAAGINLARTVNFQDANSLNTQAFNAEISGNLTGTGTIFKEGTGRLTLTGAANTASGAINVLAGRLDINSSIGASTTNAITVSAGATLGGTGTVDRGITIQTAGIFSPGNSPGTFTNTRAVAAAVTFSAGSVFAFEINNATGTVGVNWGLLDINAGGAVLPVAMLVRIIGLDGSGNPGAIANFNPLQTYEWTFLTTSLGFSGTPFANVLFGFDDQFSANNPNTGFFTVVQVNGGTGLALRYAPIPEPVSLVLGGLGMAAAGCWAERRRRARRRAKRLA